MFLIDPDPDALRRLYAVPASPAVARRPFVRANFIVTVDGRVTGRDGTSTSINDPADKRVFDLLRQLSDTVLVGAGTVRQEGYGTIEAPASGGAAPDLVVVSNSGIMPDSVVESPSHDDGVPRGRALLATHAAAPTEQDVTRLICGESVVEETTLLERLHADGARSVLCEGGPHLLTSLLAAGLVDEIAVTTAPLLVGTVSSTFLTTAPVEAPLQWRGGAVIEGTVFALWRVARD